MKLQDLLKDIELGKVYTDKDKPPFKVNEDYKNSEWEVYVADDPYGKNQKIVKKAKSKRAAVILYNKLIKTDKYFEVGMRVVKEGLDEAFGGVQSGPKFSSPEAQKVVDGALKQYAKDLRKLQYRVVKDWMSKAKSGVIDFFDLVRGFEKGDVSRAHPYETEFLQKVLTRDKIVDRFRKYFGGKKGKKR
jgi:hypothetical protein